MGDSDFENDTITECNIEEIEERCTKHNGEEVIKKYIKGKFLGKGGFAKCYELKCLNNKKTLAGKIIAKANIMKASAKNKLKSEIKIHKSWSHHNIVKFEHYFEDNDNVYILWELCKSKTLNELLKKRKILTEIEVKYYLSQILSAVKYMHKNKVIHRDLKWGNLFLSSTLEIKIGDFGWATKLEYDGERKHTVCGTPNYIAPEIWEGGSNGHSYEVDYWAIGVIVYTLIIGRPPFETDEVKETYQRINSNNYSFPNTVFISPEAKDFIKKILINNPNNRLTPETMLTHPFMTTTSIPKEWPHYTVCNPPKVDFFRNYKTDSTPITSVTQLSFDNDKENLEILRNFAWNTIKKCDMNKGFIDFKTSSRNNKWNWSETKEKHVLWKHKIKEVDMKSLTYCDTIFDYSDKFGMWFKMNCTHLIGCIFNDKSIWFKYIGRGNVFYENKRKGILKPKCFDSKNIITDIKQKYETIINFEKYITSNTKDISAITSKTAPWDNSNGGNVKHVYIKKIIKSDLALLMKYSNKIIQLTFKDQTKIVIDNDNTQQVYFYDKNDKNYHYSIHLVNKCTNKRFWNRYEHYKKIFFEKMDERFQKIQQLREAEFSTPTQVDLNKTT